MYAFAGLLILSYLWYEQRLDLQGILGFVYAASNAWGLVLVTLLLGYGLVAIPQWLHVLSYDKRHVEAIYAQAVAAEDARLSAKFELMDVFNHYRDEAGESGGGGASKELREILKVGSHSLPSSAYSFYMLLGSASREDFELSAALAAARRSQHRWSDLVDTGWALEDRMAFHNVDAPLHGSAVERLRHSLMLTGHSLGSYLTRAAALFCAILSVGIISGQATMFWDTKWSSLLAIGYDELLWALGIVQKDGYVPPVYIAVLGQVGVGLPLLYVAGCCYWSLFRVKVAGTYGLYTHHHTDSASLLWCASMVTRLSFPVAYNYLKLLRIPDSKTSFGRMFGTPISAAPIIGEDFVSYFPLLILVFSLLQLTNMYHRLVRALGLSSTFEFEGSGLRADAATVEEGRKLLHRERLRRANQADLEAGRASQYRMVAFNRGNAGLRGYQPGRDGQQTNSEESPSERAPLYPSHGSESANDRDEDSEWAFADRDLADIPQELA
ncbi:mitogen-activated protein kinase kinase [Perkinsus olseni]|uniref:Mitogen-activated protein kinase kinase n=1 Tax=Perkinsus olseni TaxID=32597 RepID=A0A7J6MXN7_PEROL|nr:mitogen-activated protein kinase kinase [Perkinsus olseni]KAF4676313.1 mitogen-activated protein kinase kinase [Perkinsus olseni]